MAVGDRDSGVEVHGQCDEAGHVIVLRLEIA